MCINILYYRLRRYNITYVYTSRRRILIFFLLLLLLLHCAPAYIMCAIRGRTHYEHLLTVVFISPPDNAMEVCRPPLDAEITLSVRPSSIRHAGCRCRLAGKVIIIMYIYIYRVRRRFRNTITRHRNTYLYIYIRRTDANSIRSPEPQRFNFRRSGKERRGRIIYWTCSSHTHTHR